MTRLGDISDAELEDRAQRARSALAAAGGLVGQQRVADVIGVSSSTVSRWFGDDPIHRPPPGFPYPILVNASRVWTVAEVFAFARRDGAVCPACGRPIRRNQRGVHEDGRYVHERCAEARA